VSKALPHFHRRLRELCLIAALATVSACAGGYRLAPSTSALSNSSAAVNWLVPSAADDGRVLARWRAGVGQPLVASSSRTTASGDVDGLTIVSWNVALGAGDVAELFNRVQRERPTHAIVLLIQEAYRGGVEVPLTPLNAAFAARIAGTDGREIDDVAKALDLWAYYVPSMRNGPPGISDQDRGNAILSTIPLADLMAIELPFERQRRVAVAATVHGTGAKGEPWALRVASVHLDNMAGLSRGYVGGEYARMRQARGLRDAFRGSDPLILAGDFNTWFGFRDGAYVETARAFPQTRVIDGRRTFMGLLRLDHVFYRLPEGWRAEVHRAESALGSDHHALITTITF
jgi:endonuclease/exonuclease/phosphatase family metal-dependent hydrolase